eukprot:14819400-Alexandrium_andersonii.AAC.1
MARHPPSAEVPRSPAAAGANRTHEMTSLAGCFEYRLAAPPRARASAAASPQPSARPTGATPGHRHPTALAKLSQTVPLTNPLRWQRASTPRP